MRMHLEVWKSMAERYAAIWRAVWEKRHLLKSLERNSDERAFLPAALELQETPLSPLPRTAMWLIIGFAAFALLWAIFGKLDVVVTAQGKIIPSDRTKVIQPMETATVKAIYVQDGQMVKANDLLLELDATAAKADQKRSYGDWVAARLARARALAFLKAIRSPAKRHAGLALPETKTLLEDIASEQISEEEKTLAAQIEEYSTNLQKYNAEIAQGEAAIASGREQLSQLQETLPIVKEKADDYKKLFEKDYVSKHDYLDKEQAKIEKEHEAAAQAGKLEQLESALKESRHAKETWMAQTIKTVRETLSQNEQKSLETNQQRIKAEQQVRLMELHAPVAGKVQQLAVHTIGGVVTPAQPLLSIVPDKDSVEIEAMIQNKDIGFVREGQEAVVKVEAFPYTRYGTIPGRVKTISLDAITDEKKGLLYSSRVLMLKHTMAVENKTIPLSPGMEVAVEIKTGKRRVIEYFLSPLLVQADESLKER